MTQSIREQHESTHPASNEKNTFAHTVVKNEVIHSVQKSIEALQKLLLPQNIAFIQDVSAQLAFCFQKGNKVLCAGNGGSMCDAMHFVEELTGFFHAKRRALPALAISDVGHITCVGNDIGYDHIFARGVEAHGKEGDVFIGLTTSGNSPNIVKAFAAAKQRGMHTVAFLGKEGGVLKGVADYEMLIDGFVTSDRIQEAHMTALHIIVQIVEHHLFPSEVSCNYL